MKVRRRRALGLAWCWVLAALGAGLAGTAPAQQSNGVLREVYLGIGGGAISDLTNSASFPNSPSFETIEPVFEAPQNFADSYGTRHARAGLPARQRHLLLLDRQRRQRRPLPERHRQPAQKSQIAAVASWTGYREWTKEAGQESAGIALVGGQRYYLEALQKEGGGGDNLSVRWQLPDGTIEEPIPNNRLLVYGLGRRWLPSNRPTSPRWKAARLLSAWPWPTWLGGLPVVAQRHQPLRGDERQLHAGPGQPGGQRQHFPVLHRQFLRRHQQRQRPPHRAAGHDPADPGRRRQPG